MVSSGIRPRLRALGFRGSGTTFVLPSKSHHALLGLQKSAFSDRDALKFTVNITVAAVAAWEAARTAKPRLPEKPAANTLYGSFIWQSRIGRLLPAGQDHWWWLAADDDWRPVADEVVQAIESFGLPAMKEQLQQPSGRGRTCADTSRVSRQRPRQARRQLLGMSSLRERQGGRGPSLPARTAVTSTAGSLRASSGRRIADVCSKGGYGQVGEHSCST